MLCRLPENRAIAPKDASHYSSWNSVIPQRISACSCKHDTIQGPMKTPKRQDRQLFPGSGGTMNWVRSYP